MKKLIFFLFVLITQYISTYSQNCKDFLILQNGKTVVMTIYNKKGKEDGKQIWRISNVKNQGNTTSGTVKSELKDKDGVSINKATNEVKCTSGSLQMNMKMMLNEAQLKQMGNAKVTAKGEFMDYPSTVKEGDLLKDGNLEMDITTEKGMEMSLNLEVSNRKVGAKESITSPAGTWDCFKITSKQKMVTKVAGIGIPMKFDVTEWYAPGVGVIKTQSKYGSTLITSIQ